MTAALNDEYDTALARSATIRHAPRREPLFDDEVVLPHHAHSSHDQPLPFVREPDRARGAARTGFVAPAGPLRATGSMLIGVCEAAAGKRPMRQLDDHLSPEVAQDIAAAVATSVRATGAHWLQGATVRSVRGGALTPVVAETCATIVTREGRVQAVALRLELNHDVWRCTCLEGL